MRFHLGRWLVGFGVLCLGIVLLFAYRKNRSWEAMLVAKAELQASLESLPSSRPVLHGESIEGRAFDEYNRFVGEYGSLLSSTAEEERIAYTKALAANNSRSVKLRNSLLHTNRSVLEALERGARCTDPRYPISWEEGIPHDLPSLRRSRLAMTLAILAAERHLDEEHPELAVNSLLDAMQLARDVMEVPILICDLMGSSLLSDATEALLEDGHLEQFPRAEQERLARALELLDSGITSNSYSIEGELLGLANLIMQPGQPDLLVDFDLAIDTWSYAFSPRLMYSDYILSSKRHCDRIRKVEEDDWVRRSALIATVEVDAKRSPNTITSSQSRYWRRREYSRRGAIAQLRLLRAALEYQLTGQKLPLPDPFRDELRFSEIGGKLRIESYAPAGHPEPAQFTLELPLNER